MSSLIKLNISKVIILLSSKNNKKSKQFNLNKNLTFLIENLQLNKLGEKINAMMIKKET